MTIRAALVTLALLGTGCAAAPSSAPTPTVSPTPDVDDATIVTVSYGDADDQVMDLHLPATRTSDVVVILLHGGFWQDEFRRDEMTLLAEDLPLRGHVAVNVEYARVGSRGGWPTTFTDVATAVDALPAILAEHTNLPPDAPLAVVGHSAGGHLALWVAGRALIAPNMPGADPGVVVCGAISLAGVTDLRAAVAEPPGRGPVRQLIGGLPENVPRRYDAGSPIELLPTGIPTLLLHGRGDAVVPSELSTRYVDAATRAGDPSTLALTGDDHFSVVDPTSEAWSLAVDWLTDCGSSTS